MIQMHNEMLNCYFNKSLVLSQLQAATVSNTQK